MKLTKLQSQALAYFVEVELKQTLKSDLKAFQDAMPGNYSNSCHRLNIMGLIDHDNKLTDSGNSVYFSL